MTSRFARFQNLYRLDFGLCAVIALLASLAYLFLPPGAFARVALAVAILFFVPGYLAIMAFTRPPNSSARHVQRMWLSVGFSPIIVGLLALSTALVRGAFQPGIIVAVVTGGCLLLAIVAEIRRRRAVMTAVPALVPE